MCEIRTELRTELEQKLEQSMFHLLEWVTCMWKVFFNCKERKIHVRYSELKVTREFGQCSLYCSTAWAIKTLLNQKTLQRGSKLHNCSSALLFGFTESFPSRNLKVLYQHEGTTSYVQTAYAYFRDHTEAWRVWVGCLKSHRKNVTQENIVWLILSTLFNLSFTPYAINHKKLSSNQLENPGVITNLTQPLPAN